MEDKCEKIPKILHIIWIGKQPVPQMVKSWYIHHKNWNIKIWNSKDIKNLKLDNQLIYNLSKKRYNQKSDIARLEILYRYGGVYVDADIYNIKNIDSLLDNDLFFCQEKQNLISNSIIGCKKKHPIIRKLIRKMKITYNYNSAIWKTTGPGFITKYLKKTNLITIPDSNKHIDIVSQTNNLTIYPYYYVNMMKDIIKDCIFSNVKNEKDIVDKIQIYSDSKDLRYLLYNKISKENIYGVQLWMGGKSTNYSKKIDLNILDNLIRTYIQKL
jgi:mannosyltransferase OCH1-like enzyme